MSSNAWKRISHGSITARATTERHRIPDRHRTRIAIPVNTKPVHPHSDDDDEADEWPD